MPLPDYYFILAVAMALFTRLSLLLLSACCWSEAAKRPVDMKLLVLGADGNEPSLAAVRSTLDRLGTPYDLVLLKDKPLPTLANSSKGFYQGIILATGNLAICTDGTCRSALSADAWAALDTYTASHGVRTVSYYTYPESRYGLKFLNSVATTIDQPGAVRILPEGTKIFSDLNAGNTLEITGAFVYLATASPANGEKTTPILEMSGSTVGALHTKADGREYLALTIDQSASLLHSRALGYGVVNWVTGGKFLGERHIYLSPQVDDVFLPNHLFDAKKDACRPTGFVSTSFITTSNDCERLRIAGSDLNAVAQWQDRVNADRQTKGIEVGMAFNGSGAKNRDDSLVTAAIALRDKFTWINHTYDHKSLDCINRGADERCRAATEAEATDEIRLNVQSAAELGLSMDPISIVTPENSGLQNPDFLKSAAGLGIRYVIADTSRLAWQTMKPITAIQSEIEPSIVLIPRYPTDLYFNAVTTRQGVPGSEVDEFNFFYGPTGLFPFFPRDRNYDEILESQSRRVVNWMLGFEPYPLMFHQSNLFFYEPGRSLMTDTLDAVLTRFRGISKLPVTSLSQADIGRVLERRLAYDASGTHGVLMPDGSVQIDAARDAEVPVTGICAQDCQLYGGQLVSFVKVSAGKTVTFNRRVRRTAHCGGLR